MRARVKETGEIVTLRNMYADGTAKDTNGHYYHQGDILEYIEEGSEPIDWEQRRYEIAKEAMSGILSDENCVGYASVAAEYSENEKHTYPKAISRYAVACADALIAELKGGEE